MQTSAAELIGQTTLTSPVATSERRTLHPFVASWRWTYELYHPIHSTMLAEALRFASDVLDGEEPRWLTFLGASGVGKTFLLRQLVRLLRAASTARDLGARVWVTKTPTGFATPRAHSIIPARDLDTWQSPKDFAREFEVLFIEDIAAVANTEKGAGAVTMGRLAELLQLRSRSWTLIDANLSIAQVEQTFDGRIASRLRRDGATCIVIPDDVPDYSLRIRG